MPRDWLDLTRQTVAADVETLFETLPAEAAEALLDFATGGTLDDHIAPAGDSRADPYRHPDSLRRFRVVEHREELEAALDAPFESWATFLHPAQRGPVEKDWSGPVRISGSAGTGKTIVALHRAFHLARRPGSRVLLTTFSRELAGHLSEKADLLARAHPGTGERVAVQTLDDMAAELYAEWFGAATLARPDDLKNAIADARAHDLGAGHSAAFLFEEWDDVIDAWAVEDSAAYSKVPRIGRKIRLGVRQRETAWAVFDHVRGWLNARGLLTTGQLYERLERALREGKAAFPFTHVVVDEAQDLSVPQVRFLGALSGSSADMLFFTGDLGQRIFHLPFSWKALGVDIRGRSRILKVCYRTSHQIRSLADRLLDAEIADQDGIVETRSGTVSVFDGPAPEVALFTSETEESTAVAAWLAALVDEGLAPDRIGVLARGETRLPRAVAAAGPVGARALTMHQAKGLEFRAVAVIAADEDALPDAERIAAVGDLADLAAIEDQERHLLYVACTRARDRLWLSGVEPGSEFLDDLDV